MKVSEILDKITLKLPGGGNLPLKKYAPYIVNSDEEIEEINSGNNSKFIDQIPDLYGYFLNDNEIICTYDELKEYILNRTEKTILNAVCLYKNEPNLDEHIYLESIGFYYNIEYPVFISCSGKHDSSIMENVVTTSFEDKTLYYIEENMMMA